MHLLRIVDPTMETVSSASTDLLKLAGKQNFSEQSLVNALSTGDRESWDKQGKKQR